MEDLIVLGILLMIVGAAIHYIYKEKKKGIRCVGCPFAGRCSIKESGNGTESCKCHTSSN